MVELAQKAIVDDALRALLYEVSVNPKPGLVDPVSSGPHPDMDVFTFIDSTVSLREYFTTCATTGVSFTGSALPELFTAIRPVGVAAERSMFAATKGVNTHKGAIFSLGILVTAAAYQLEHDQLTLMSIVKAMLVGLTTHDFDHLADKPDAELTAGERQFLQFGITGIRGEAEAGYPTIMTVGLPALKRSKGTTNQRLLDTLIAIMGHSVDTNLVKRAKSNEIVAWAHQQAQQYFELGGSQTAEGMAFLAELNETFLQRNLSLGGSADLLILTIFLGLRKQLL